MNELTTWLIYSAAALLLYLSLLAFIAILSGGLLLAADRLVVLRAHVVLLQTRATLLVEQVEGDLRARFRGAEELDRNRDEAERNGGRPDGASRHSRRLA